MACRAVPRDVERRSLGSVPLGERWLKLERHLDLKLDSLLLLRENRTCWIYHGKAAGEAVVVKQYKQHARRLCESEAAALRLYTELCAAQPGLLSSRIRAVNERTGTLCVTFIEGELMSDVLRKSWYQRRERARCRDALARISELLRRIRERTVSAAPPSPFLKEYLIYASGQLEGNTALGKLFSGYVASAKRLYEDLEEAGDLTSLSHGDLVCANLILTGNQVGIIDFANANPAGHPLDDLYNMEITCENLLHVSRRAKQELSEALWSALDLRSTDPRTRRFYWEYHRRRWLHLQLNASWLQRARAVTSLPIMLRRSHPPLQLSARSGALLNCSAAASQ